MKPILSKIFLMILLYSFSTVVTAQSAAGRTIDLVGYVMDSFTENGVEKAKLTLMTKDSVVIDTASVSNFRPAGNLVASSYCLHVPAKIDTYLIKVECEGYKSAIFPYKLKHTGRVIRVELPPFKLSKNTKLSLTEENELSEVTVRATKIKFYHKGDTLIYNADAFNLPEGSMLDELIRQMPGARIDANGEIFINEKKIDYLTLNGKELFKGNNLALLENMPYYTVKNIKVFEQNKDKDAYLNTKTALKDNVMDVLLKKEYAQSNFGNVEAGLGTKDRWQAQAFDGYMRESFSATAYANLNNTNKTGVPGGDGAFTDNEAPKSTMSTKKAGVSTIVEKKSALFSIATDLSANWQDIDLDQQQKQTTGLPQNSINKILQNQNNNRNSAFSLYNRILKRGWSFVQFQTNIDYARNKSDDMATNATFEKDMPNEFTITGLLDKIGKTGRGAFDYLQNYHVKTADDRTHTLSVREDIDMSRALPWGDDIYLHAIAQYSDKEQKMGENNTVTYYLPKNDSIVSYVASDNTKSRTYNYTFEGIYTFNFLNYMSLQIGYQYAQTNVSTTRQRTVDELFDKNSYHTNNLSREYKPMLVWSYKKGNLQLIANFDVRVLNNKMSYSNSTIDTTLNRTYVDLCPKFKIKWQGKFSRIYFFNKLESYTKPTVLNLVEVLDTSNPLVLSKGNSNLKKEMMYDYQFFYTWNYTPRHLIINFSSESQFMFNMICMTSLYNEKDGTFLMTPQNLDGTLALNFCLGIEKGLGESKEWSIKNEISYSHLQEAAMSGYTNKGLQAYKTARNTLDETARLIFQHKTLTLKLNAGFSYNGSHNKANASISDAWDIRYGFNLTCTLPWSIKFAGDFTCLTRRGYCLEELNKTRLISNLSLYKTFMKNKVTVQCRVYDIFHQLTSIERYAFGQTITETTYNCMPRYGMISIGYRFGKK